MLHMQPSFHIIILGCSGGPIDRHTCAYLVKSAKAPWEPKCMISIDAGTLVSGITDVLMDDVLKERAFANLELPYKVQSDDGTSSTDTNTSPIAVSSGKLALPKKEAALNAWYILTEFVSTICLTHEHLDHICGIVLNSAGLQKSKPITLAAQNSCIDHLLKYVFNGVIWPNLTDEGFLPAELLTILRLNAFESYSNVANHLSVSAYPVSHGSAMDRKIRQSFSELQFRDSFSATEPHIINGNSGSSSTLMVPTTTVVTPGGFSTTNGVHSSYESTAYFIEDDISKNVLLIWGDVEPDCVSFTPRNKAVWERAAGYVKNGHKLAGIIIECSFTSPHDDKLLFGHFTPKYLIAELEIFAALCRPENPCLDNLPIIITHIKDPVYVSPSASGDCLDDNNCDQVPGDIILQELVKSAQQHNLKCLFHLASPGQTFDI